MENEGSPEAVEPQAPRFDEAQIQLVLQQLKAEQNLTLGIVGGVAGALAGAILWALITAVTNFQIGWMAVGVGFLVGIAVRTLGKGIDKIFGFAGAALALLGCLAGNILAVCAILAKQSDVSVLDVVFSLDFEMIKEMMIVTFSPMDLLFYGIAIYEGYKLSFRQVTEEDLAKRITGAAPGNPG